MGVKIYGHSDDCVEVDGDLHDEFNPPEDGAIAIEIRASAHETAPGVRVVAAYAPDRCSGSTWRLGVEQIDEDVPVPWPITVKPEHGYSLAVHVDSPPSAVFEVKHIDRNGNVRGADDR